MESKQFSNDEIVEILIAHKSGLSVNEVCKKYNCKESFFYKWKSVFTHMSIDELKRFRRLMKENKRLKKMFTDLSKDNEILKSACVKKAQAEKSN